jgi:hypothetical protein
VKAFWKQATLNGLPIKDFVKRISHRGSVGTAGCGSWSTRPRVPPVRTVAEAKKAKVRIYAYIVEPEHALDMSYDELGELNWILIREHQRDDGDPITARGYVYPRFRLWTRTTSQLFVCVDKKGVPIDPDSKRVDSTRTGLWWPSSRIEHRLGVVPVIPADNVITDDPYCVAGADRRRRLPRSRGGELPVQHGRDHPGPDLQPARHAGAGLMPGTADDETKLSKLVELGTKRIFTYNGEGGAKSRSTCRPTSSRPS